MHVRFSGVRGSVPWASVQSIGYGCNTPCVEIAHDSGERLILDAGSGLVGAGEVLLDGPRAASILLTHYHWDHIQGLPFFRPFYHPGTRTTIWSPSLDASSASWIEVIFQPPFFQVAYDRLPSAPDIRWLQPGDTKIGNFSVCAVRLNHPGGSLAYRITGSRGDLVYATDHELGEARFDEPLREFVAGAAGLILDAHFTPDEAPAYRGWGHSTWADAARFAAAAGVGRLWLFHHKPGRTDRELREIEAHARTIFPSTTAAAEGEHFEI